MENTFLLLLILSCALLTQSAFIFAFLFKQSRFYLVVILTLGTFLIFYSLSTYFPQTFWPLSTILLLIHLTSFSKLLGHALHYRKENYQSDYFHNLGLLCSEICHELASPLMVIETSTLILKNKLAKTQLTNQKDIDKSFQRIDRQVKKLYHILLRFRSLTSSKSLTSEWHVVHVEKALSESLEKLSALSAQVTMVKTIEMVCQEIYLGLEQAELQHIFSSLILNAYEARTDDQFRITVTITEDESNLFLRIQDSGKGFSREHWDKAFSPFYSLKKERKGLGLGLPVVFKMLEKAQGTIKLKSEFPTIIEIQLPTMAADKSDSQSALLSPSHVL